MARHGAPRAAPVDARVSAFEGRRDRACTAPPRPRAQDMEKDRDLFWVAEEGLKAPLPKEWKPCKSPEGEIYYFNFETGER